MSRDKPASLCTKCQANPPLPQFLHTDINSQLFCDECLDEHISTLNAKKQRLRMKLRAFDKVLSMEESTGIAEKDTIHRKADNNDAQEQHNGESNENNVPLNDSISSNDYQKLIEQLKNEKHTLQDQLRQYLTQESSSSQEPAQAAQYYTQLNDYTAQHTNLCDEYLSLCAKKTHLMQQLTKLVPAHVLNEAFTINCDGLFGTINGMRLGRLSIDHVDWIEVNSAFGQVALLLNAVAQYKHFPFDKVSLQPRGAFSRVERGSSTYDLVGGAGFTGFFWKKKFDNALRGLLDALHQLCTEAERDLDETRPYPISGDNIGGFSIKYVEKMEDKWTNALKCLLVNAKFLLVWVCAT